MYHYTLVDGEYMELEKKKRFQMLLIVFAGSMMVAYGLRIMIQGLFDSTSYYASLVPTTLDFWFDWFTLAFIGGIVFLWGFIEFYRMKKGHTPTFESSPITPT